MYYLVVEPSHNISQIESSPQCRGSLLKNFPATHYCHFIGSMFRGEDLFGGILQFGIQGSFFHWTSQGSNLKIQRGKPRSAMRWENCMNIANICGTIFSKFNLNMKSNSKFSQIFPKNPQLRSCHLWLFDFRIPSGFQLRDQHLKVGVHVFLHQKAVHQRMQPAPAPKNPARRFREMFTPKHSQ